MTFKIFVSTPTYIFVIYHVYSLQSIKQSHKASRYLSVGTNVPLLKSLIDFDVDYNRSRGRFICLIDQHCTRRYSLVRYKLQKTRRIRLKGDIR